MNTLNYYNKNACVFAESTVNVDFKHVQDRFLKELSKSDARILDFGCGSGRDTKYFLNCGYQVDAIDGSEELCKIASEYTGIKVKQMLFQELNETEKYDGIWACSSILHLSKKELPKVLQKISNALKKDGILYTSFKYGEFEGERNGRYFTDFTEDTFLRLLSNVEGLEVKESWVTGDVRKGRGEEQWLNLIVWKR